MRFAFRSWDEIVDPSDVILKYKPENNALLMSVALLNDHIFKDDLPKYCISLTKLLYLKMLRNFLYKYIQLFELWVIRTDNRPTND
jgi:hypothetical protein